MIIHIVILMAWLSNWSKLSFKRWTKPATVALSAGALTDMMRSRADLLAENAMLRQQLIVLKRQVKRPKLADGDRIRLVVLARITQHWQYALHIVQPETLLRWHRELFRRHWRCKSRTGEQKSRLPQETIDLIRQMAVENRLWGAERIRGELLKLGIEISKRTVQRYMPKQRRKSGQTWATFLRNHAGDIWACDFTVVHDLLFRPLYIFIIIELKRRRVVHAAVTRHPTDAWTAQQLREATAWGKGPRYLIRDRDKKYGSLFSAVARGTSIKELKTPIQAPRANAVCERFMGSLKRECLDHMFVLHQEQLHRTVKEYVNFYNHMRPHQGIQQQMPVLSGVDSWPASPGNTTRIMSRPILRGLHHSYSHTAHLN